MTDRTHKAQGLAVLHDHLDGGIRPATMIDLAEQIGWPGLPAADPDELQRILTARAACGSLAGYLSCFDYIQPLLQSAPALQRIAAEAVEDLTADGITDAEIRFAPQAHTLHGLAIDDAIEAVLDGLRHSTTRARLIITALRHEPDSIDIASAALRWADNGVVGFDIAGPEHGHPIGDHADAITRVRARLGITIHAGEASGPESVRDALDLSATRIGHGVALADCLDDPMRCPGLLDRVIDGQVALEICPTSNLHTGIVPDIAAHPIDRLRCAGVNVTINTDNRTLSNTTLTREHNAVAHAFGWTPTTLQAMIDSTRAALFDR